MLRPHRLISLAGYHVRSSHAQGPVIVPIPGAKRRSYLEENCAAAELQLRVAEIAGLDAAFPPGATAGTRYPEKQLKALGI